MFSLIYFFCFMLTVTVFYLGMWYLGWDNGISPFFGAIFSLWLWWFLRYPWYATYHSRLFFYLFIFVLVFIFFIFWCRVLVNKYSIQNKVQLGHNLISYCDITFRACVYSFAYLSIYFCSLLKDSWLFCPRRSE